MENLENTIGEQPDNFEVMPVATDLENVTAKSEGSPIGKFKNANALIDAYNELQSEFTRKCQKLSDAEKKLQEASQNLDIESNKSDVKPEEFAWNKNVSEFLQSHKNAGELVEDITNEIISDDDIRNREDALDIAYLRVLEKKYQPLDTLAKDEKFLEKYVYSNELVKNKIIKEYVSSLQNAQNPVVINNSSFTRGVANSNRFNTLDEAKQYVEKLFKF